MKRIFCALIALLMVAVLFAGCTVTTTVEPKYVDDFAADYADATEVDKDGNVSYEFKEDKYEEFVEDYYEEVKEDSRIEIKSSGQYSYYNPEITEIIVGVTPEAYEELGEEKLKQEAQSVGEAALKFQMNTTDPKGELTVTYRNANTSEVYFTITVTA